MLTKQLITFFNKKNMKRNFIGFYEEDDGILII